MSHQLLLADGSLTIQRVIKLTFADEDLKVITVGDGNQAVAAIDQSPPDIVLADISMPGRSGYDVAQHLRDTPRLAHIPVVLLMGAFDKLDEARASAVGCDRVLSKPFDPQVVISCVHELLGRPKKIATSSPSLEAVDEVGQVEQTEQVEQIEQVQTASEPSADIDAYFDRLDLAFANLTTSPRAAAGGEPEAFTIEIEGLDSLVTTAEASDGVPIGVEPPAYASDRSAFGHPFEAAGRDARVSMPVEDSTAAASETPFELVDSSTAAPVVSDELIEEIAARVLDRLMARLATENIPDLVASIAERLVRAEIDSIKNRL